MITLYFQFTLNVEEFGHLFCYLGSPPLHQVFYPDVVLNKDRSVPKENPDAYNIPSHCYYYEALFATSLFGRPVGWPAWMKGNTLMTLVDWSTWGLARRCQ